MKTSNDPASSVTTKENEYLRRAEDAEREADRIMDRQLRLSWRRIADDYRALARAAQD